MRKGLLVVVIVLVIVSYDDAGVARGTVFQERYNREQVSKPAISLKNRSGGLCTVERL